jgi:hypothetical protein
MRASIRFYESTTTRQYVRLLKSLAVNIGGRCANVNREIRSQNLGDRSQKFYHRPQTSASRREQRDKIFNYL